MALHTKDMQTIALTTEQTYFQKHYNMQHRNAQQCRILPSDKQMQQLLRISGAARRAKTRNSNAFFKIA